MHYDFEEWRNITKNELTVKIELLQANIRAAFEDEKQFKSLIVYILTHGNDDCVLLADKNYVAFSDIKKVFFNLDFFNEEKFTIIYFFGSCRTKGNYFL